MRENEKVHFYKSDDGKDVVIKLSNYDSKLKSNNHVMHEIEQEDNIDDKHKIEIYHKTMNQWRIVVENHPTINFHFLNGNAANSDIKLETSKKVISTSKF